jgi:hypothetical protein
MASDGETLSTRDPDQVRTWARERDCKPVKIKGTEDMIEIDCPGYSGGDRFEEISWDEWGRIFSERGLELQYQETTKDGEQSNFNRITDAGS